MIVMKFGGTSVGSADAFAQVAKIVSEKAQEQDATARPGLVVVTSAMSGVTNMLSAVTAELENVRHALEQEKKSE